MEAVAVAPELRRVSLRVCRFLSELAAVCEATGDCRSWRRASLLLAAALSPFWTQPTPSDKTHAQAESEEGLAERVLRLEALQQSLDSQLAAALTLLNVARAFAAEATDETAESDCQEAASASKDRLFEEGALVPSAPNAADCLSSSAASRAASIWRQKGIALLRRWAKTCAETLLDEATGLDEALRKPEGKSCDAPVKQALLRSLQEAANTRSKRQQQASAEEPGEEGREAFLTTAAVAAQRFVSLHLLALAGSVLALKETGDLSRNSLPESRGVSASLLSREIAELHCEKRETQKEETGEGFLFLLNAAECRRVREVATGKPRKAPCPPALTRSTESFDSAEKKTPPTPLPLLSLVNCSCSEALAGVAFAVFASGERLAALDETCSEFEETLFERLGLCFLVAEVAAAAAASASTVCTSSLSSFSKGRFCLSSSLLPCDALCDAKAEAESAWERGLAVSNPSPSPRLSFDWTKLPVSWLSPTSAALLACKGGGEGLAGGADAKLLPFSLCLLSSVRQQSRTALWAGPSLLRAAADATSALDVLQSALETSCLWTAALPDAFR